MEIYISSGGAFVFMIGSNILSSGSNSISYTVDTWDQLYCYLHTDTDNYSTEVDCYNIDSDGDSQ